MQFNTTQFYPNKLGNFHGCKLFVQRDEGAGSGVIDIILDVVKLVNATYASSKKNLAGDLIATLTSRYDNSLTSFPFVTDTMIFIVPQGELFTPVEKMFKPFAFEVWIAILITLNIGLVSIWLISLFPVVVRNFVFGRFINTPSLNLLSIFLNGGQHKVPTRNFSRFLLTNFVIWCLIIRTCYQSELFKHLQSDERKPPVSTFAQIAEKNFTVLMSGVESFHENLEAQFYNPVNSSDAYLINAIAEEKGSFL
jgi:hypothetical protein